LVDDVNERNIEIDIIPFKEEQVERSRKFHLKYPITATIFALFGIIIGVLFNMIEITMILLIPLLYFLGRGVSTILLAFTGKEPKTPKEFTLAGRRVIDTHFLRAGIVLDYSGQSLIKIDESVSLNLSNDLRESGMIDIKYHALLGIYLALGCYFGEVIIQNIGGKWIIPGRLKYWWTVLTGNPEFLINNWYIDLNSNRIPVLNIARSRLDGSGRIKSLYEAYKKIETTGKWEE